MKISIAKVGQDIVFNRSDSRVDRSNANGNVGLYKMVKMLNDLLGMEHDLFMISGNDISSFNGDLSIMDCKDNPQEAVMMSDVILIIAGLSTYEKNDVLLDVISSSRKPVIILCEDPRCYRSMDGDERFSGFNVKLVLWQTRKPAGLCWHGRHVEDKYFPLQMASAYEHDEGNMPAEEEKVEDFIIAANTSEGEGSMYDRVAVMAEVLEGIGSVKVYGRLSERERSMLAGQDIIGEVKYNDMQEAMRSASSMLLVPIEDHWVTSKYVECLMNRVLPVFHSDYAVELIGLDNVLLTVSSSDDMKFVLHMVKRSKKVAFNYASLLYNRLIKPYVDGKLLTSMLMQEVSMVASTQ